MEVNESNEGKGQKKPPPSRQWLVNDWAEVWLSRVTHA
jgi:hypothetical protein